MMIPFPRLNWNDLATGFTLLKESVPKVLKNDEIRAAGLDFLNSKDEAAFAEVTSAIDPEDKETIIAWIKSDEKNVGHKFRKIVTTHPNKEAREKILLSYADEADHSARTRRLNSETLQPWFIEAFKKFCKDKKYLSVYNWLEAEFGDLKSEAAAFRVREEAKLAKQIKDKQDKIDKAHWSVRPFVKMWA